jgi:hypothetical protein
VASDTAPPLEWKGWGAESVDPDAPGAGPPLSAPVAAAIAMTSGGGESVEALEAVSAPEDPVLGVMAVLPLFSSISIVTRIVSPQARIA